MIIDKITGIKLYCLSETGQGIRVLVNNISNATLSREITYEKDEYTIHFDGDQMLGRTIFTIETEPETDADTDFIEPEELDEILKSFME